MYRIFLLNLVPLKDALKLQPLVLELTKNLVHQPQYPTKWTDYKFIFHCTLTTVLNLRCLTEFWIRFELSPAIINETF